MSRNNYLPCFVELLNIFFLFLFFFFKIFFGFHFNISICFTFHYQICSRLVGGSSQRLHYRGIYKRQALSFSCVCVCMCAVGNFRATGFPHQTPSVSSLFYSFLCLLTCSSVGFFAPFFPSSFEREERRGKKIEQEMRKGPFFLLPPHFIHLRLEAQVPD